MKIAHQERDFNTQRGTIIIHYLVIVKHTDASNSSQTLLNNNNDNNNNNNNHLFPFVAALLDCRQKIYNNELESLLHNKSSGATIVTRSSAQLHRAE